MDKQTTSDSKKIKVFVSATSRDLRSYRDLVVQWAKGCNYEPIFQENLPVKSDYWTVVELLREQLDGCDAMIHLVGSLYGKEPTQRPEGKPRRSYTQIEYELAKSHNIPVHRFIARQNYQMDEQITQCEKERDLQLNHCERLKQGDELFHEFSCHDELRNLLLKIDLKPKLKKPRNLPFVGTLFKGRDELVKEIHTTSLQKPDSNETVVAKQVIHGLGGVGKTRLAVEYAKRYEHEYSALLFFSADSSSSLYRNLANLCNSAVLNLPEKNEPEQEVQVAAVLEWLRVNSGWLLIMDNVDNSDTAMEVEALIQELERGHVLITSRLSVWGDSISELPLYVISESDSQEFILERTNKKRRSTSTDYDDAVLLAKDLGNLPLALEQATAFIVKHGGSISEYRKRWKEQESKVLEWHDPRLMKYPASVATTWQTSFDRLCDDGRSLLNILCWLAPDPIPLTMLAKLTENEDDDNLDLENSIAELAEYSLTRWTSDQHDSIDLHQLVKEVTRYRLPKNERVGWIGMCLQMINLFVPYNPSASDFNTWPDIYIPAQNHILAIVQFSDEMLSNELRNVRVNRIVDATSRLMNYLAGFFMARSLFSEALTLYRRALAIDEAFYGPNHSSVAYDLGDFALWFQATNRFPEAEILMRRGIEIDLYWYGPANSKVGCDINNFASLLLHTGRVEAAEQLIRIALSIEEHEYGPGSPELATGLNNYAELLKRTNRPLESAALKLRAFKIVATAFGLDHPEIAAHLSNISILLSDANRLADAEPIMRHSLNVNLDAFGTAHTRVANDFNTLATLMLRTNRFTEAEPLLYHAIVINELLLGTEHPDLVRNLTNLSIILHATNRSSLAIPLMIRSVVILDRFQKKAGCRHPEIENTMAAYHSISGSSAALNFEMDQLREVAISNSEPLLEISPIVEQNLRPIPGQPHLK